MKTHEHIKFNGALLDNFLAQGCYRMHQDIFTTNLLWDAGGLYNVFWLRYPLHKFYFDKKPQKLLRYNQRFEVTTRALSITREMEMLYEIYFHSVNFEAPRNIQDFLFGDAVIENPQQDLFDSEVIEIRDKNKLIAAGIFDNGHNSIAGIMNFYDPAYKKYSLGKYLMLLKMLHAIKNKMQFYYPGYIAYNYKKFDYKLFPNHHLAEIFDAKRKVWLPYNKELIADLSEEFNE